VVAILLGNVDQVDVGPLLDLNNQALAS